MLYVQIEEVAMPQTLSLPTPAARHKAERDVAELRFVRSGLLGASCSAIMALSLYGRGTASSKRSQIARGRYLVQDVGKCGDCHSPHNARGQVVPGENLAGARLDFRPIRSVPGWVATAPPIAGLPTVTVGEAMRLLTQATDKNGRPPAPPMPYYQMSRADAAAVIEYLQSLEPAGK